MEVAVGVTTHSGWGIAVVVGLVDGNLEVVDRRRIELIDADLPRQAYHAAADLPADDAVALVAAVDRSIVDCAVDVLGALGDAVAVGVVGPTRDIPDVPTVLASHARMHASEGEQYRRGVAEAAARLGLRVVRIDPADLPAVSANPGPPWQKDHKHAAAAGLVALQSARK